MSCWSDTPEDTFYHGVAHLSLWEKVTFYINKVVMKPLYPWVKRSLKAVLIVFLTLVNPAFFFDNQKAYS